MGIGAALSGAAALTSIGTGIAGAVGGSAGAAGGSQGQQSQTQQQQGAPSWQVPYQQSTIQDAQNLYNQQSTQGPPTGYDWVAPMNWQQQAGINSQYNAGNQAASNYAPWNTAGQTLANNAQQFSNVAHNATENGISAQADPAIQAALANYALTGTMNGAPSINGNLASVATQAGTQGLSALNGAQQATNAALAQNSGGVNAAQAATQGAANSMVQSSATQNAINAADLSVNRNLTENQLPTIRAQAAAAGNTDSSREGALEGVATSQAQQNMLANAAQIEDNAYNTGAATGAQQYQNSITNGLSGASALNSTGSIAGGLTTGEQSLQQQNQQAQIDLMQNAGQAVNSNNLNFGTANTSARLAGNAQLGQGLQIGQNATNTALQGSLAGANAIYGAGQNFQTQAQGQINNQLAQYQATQQYPWQILNNMGAFTQPNTGTQTSFQGQQGGGLSGALSGALGGAATGASLYNKLSGGQTQYDGWGNPISSGSSGDSAGILSSSNNYGWGGASGGFSAL